MRYLVAALGMLALAGCSRAPDQNDRATVADSTTPAAPDVSITAAPGVAFAYHYGFRLPSTAIAAAQEAHAQACEKLGVARCRITGMKYTLRGENDIEAMLAFKLAPEIARAFGKNGIDLVTAAKGKLVDAEITGTDAGATITRLGTERAQATDGLRRLDAELAKARSATERAELRSQRAELQRQIEAGRAETAEQRESLTSTPLVFDYGSGPAVRGFDTSAPLASALDTAIGSAQFTLAAVLGVLAIFGPPALALLLVWLLWRRLRPVWRRRVASPTAPV